MARIIVLVGVSACVGWGCSTSDSTRDDPSAVTDAGDTKIAVDAADTIADSDAIDTTAHSDATNLTQPDVEQLRELLQTLTQAVGGSGAALSILLDSNATTIVDGIRYDGSADVDASTYFNIASISKTLTASRIIVLAHQGELGLDESIATYLPGVSLIDPAGDDVTASVLVRDLLRHRSGLPHQPGDQVDPATFNNDWGDPELLQKLTADWQIQLPYAPGTYHYSNMGYMLLGAIIENVEQCQFAACMGAHSDQLDLNRASFNASDVVGQAAHGRVVGNGSAHFNSPGWYASTYALPFNGAWISMPDLAAFGQILIDANAPSTPLYEMTKPVVQGGSYGLGIVHGGRDGVATLEHDGSGPGFMARLVAIPEHDIVLAVAVNGGSETAEQAERLLSTTNQMLAIIDKTP